MRSDLPVGLSLLGLSKDSPLHRSESKSPAPGKHVAVIPFGGRQPVLLAFRPRGFAPPRRFTPLRPCRFVSPCSRSWGSPCFIPSRNGNPHGAVPALRSFPSADSGRSGTCPSLRARVTGATIAGRSLHRVPCPLTLHSVHRAAEFPSLVSQQVASHPTSAAVARVGCPEPGPRGLAPSSGPLLACPLPDTKARCSLGLDRFRLPPRRPLPPLRTSRRRSPG
jgi:hypothetical protein